MKTFSEFLNEGIDLGYQFDTPDAAANLAGLYGYVGCHQVGDKWIPCETPEQYIEMLRYMKKKKSFYL